MVFVPKKHKYVRMFLGLAGYNRRFIKGFSKIDFPLFSLLIKDAEFCWTYLCQEKFEEIKERLITTHVLKGPS